MGRCLPAVAIKDWTKASRKARILEYLHRLEIEVHEDKKTHFDKRTYKRKHVKIHQNFAEGNYEYKGYNKHAKAGHKKTLEELDRDSMKFFERFGPIERVLHKEFFKKWGPYFDTGRFSALALLETVNLLIAINECADASPRTRKDLVSLFGAGTDASLVISGIVERLMKKSGGMTFRIAKGVAGPLMIVSSVCDFYGFAADAQVSFHQGDTGQGVGHAIAAVGAGTSAIAGAMVVITAVSTAALIGGTAGAAILMLTPAGWLVLAVGLIGAALMAIGTIVSAWLTDNAYEEFAARCFLGKKYFKVTSGNQSKRKATWYSPYKMPAPNLQEERENLMSLLCSFTVEAIRKNRHTCVVLVTPGLLLEEAIFELYVEYEFYDTNAKKAPGGYSELVFSPDEASVMRVRGNVTMIEEHKSSHGQIDYPSKVISATKTTPKRILANVRTTYNDRKHINRYTVYVRMRSGNTTLPPNEQWVIAKSRISPTNGDPHPRSSLDHIVKNSVVERLRNAHER